MERNPPAVICPYCRAELGPAAVRCSGCGTAHHDGCWNENGRRCTVFRCEGSQILAPALHPWLARALEFALLAAPALLLLAVFARRLVIP